ICSRAAPIRPSKRSFSASSSATRCLSSAVSPAAVPVRLTESAKSASALIDRRRQPASSSSSASANRSNWSSKRSLGGPEGDPKLLLNPRSDPIDRAVDLVVPEGAVSAPEHQPIRGASSTRGYAGAFILVDHLDRFQEAAAQTAHEGDHVGR